jgi:hypothetical protein
MWEPHRALIWSAEFFPPPGQKWLSRREGE